jgi:hypothetical protein
MSLAANGLDICIGHPADRKAGQIPKRASHASAPHNAARFNTGAMTLMGNSQIHTGDHRTFDMRRSSFDRL